MCITLTHDFQRLYQFFTKSKMVFQNSRTSGRFLIFPRSGFLPFIVFQRFHDRFKLFFGFIDPIFNFFFSFIGIAFVCYKGCFS
jgi:hypothetical protein